MTDDTLKAADAMPLEEFQARQVATRARLARETGQAVTEPLPPRPVTLPLVNRDTENVVGQVSWSPSTTWVPMGDVYVPERVDATFPGAPKQPGLELTIAVVDGVPSCTRLELKSKPTASQLAPKHLALARDHLIDWIEQVMAGVAQQTPDGWQWADPTAAQRSVKQARKRRPVTREKLERVARVYRANISGSPVKAIALAFDVSDRMAAKLVQQCRSEEYQLLSPPPGRGRKKA